MTLLLALACASGDAESPSDTAEAAPVVTWANFGQALMIEHCQPCHATTAPNRHDAPEAVTFDTHEDAILWKERILARATGDAPTMPPAIRLDDQDRELLETWLVRWEAQ